MKNKLYIGMPAGEFYGWAICGKNVISELSKIADVRYVPNIQYDELPRLQETKDFIKSITEVPNGNEYNYLQCVDNYNGGLNYRGDINVGYIFFEEGVLNDDLLEHLKSYDIIATGSHYNTDILRKMGYKAVTIHQGINCDIFKPADKKYFKDKFVIFSGGKIEHRKAQDIVAYAVGKLQRKYPDIILMTSWGNIFNKDEVNKANMDIVKNYLSPSQTIMTDLVNQTEMVKYISESDIGFFPNRSEGGTNLVMMEYMACGKTVIANNSTGQKDVLNSDYAFLSSGSKEDDLIDQYIKYIEYAYKNREQLEIMGAKAREAMLPFTWEKTAKEFLNLYE